MSDWSAARIWPNWTGVAVCCDGITSPDSSSGALGLPGWTSTKKFPSRKRFGRILSSASSWIGSAESSTSIVTRAAPLSGIVSTSVTLPTFTPAMRTCERGFRLFADSKTAVSSYGSANGFQREKPKKVPNETIAIAITPIAKLDSRLWPTRLMGATCPRL